MSVTLSPIWTMKRIDTLNFGMSGCADELDCVFDLDDEEVDMSSFGTLGCADELDFVFDLGEEEASHQNLMRCSRRKKERGCGGKCCQDPLRACLTIETLAAFQYIIPEPVKQ